MIKKTVTLFDSVCAEADFSQRDPYHLTASAHVLVKDTPFVLNGGGILTAVMPIMSHANILSAAIFVNGVALAATPTFNASLESSNSGETANNLLAAKVLTSGNANTYNLFNPDDMGAYSQLTNTGRDVVITCSSAAAVVVPAGSVVTLRITYFCNISE